jgi:hypothetical protein
MKQLPSIFTLRPAQQYYCSGSFEHCCCRRARGVAFHFLASAAAAPHVARSFPATAAAVITSLEDEAAAYTFFKSPSIQFNCPSLQISCLSRSRFLRNRVFERVGKSSLFLQAVAGGQSSCCCRCRSKAAVVREIREVGRESCHVLLVVKEVEPAAAFSPP